MTTYYPDIDQMVEPPKVTFEVRDPETGIEVHVLEYTEIELSIGWESFLPVTDAYIAKINELYQAAKSHVESHRGGQ